MFRWVAGGARIHSILFSMSPEHLICSVCGAHPAFTFSSTASSRAELRSGLSLGLLNLTRSGQVRSGLMLVRDAGLSLLSRMRMFLKQHMHATHDSQYRNVLISGRPLIMRPRHRRDCRSLCRTTTPLKSRAE